MARLALCNRCAITAQPACSRCAFAAATSWSNHRIPAALTLRFWPVSGLAKALLLLPVRSKRTVDEVWLRRDRTHPAKPALHRFVRCVRLPLRGQHRLARLSCRLPVSRLTACARTRTRAPKVRASVGSVGLGVKAVESAGLGQAQNDIVARASVVARGSPRVSRKRGHFDASDLRHFRNPGCHCRAVQVCTFGRLDVRIAPALYQEKLRGMGTRSLFYVRLTQGLTRPPIDTTAADPILIGDH